MYQVILCRLKVKLDVVPIKLFSEYFSFNMLFSLVIELGTSELHGWCSLFKSRSQIDILGDDASVQKSDHATVNVILTDWRWVCEIIVVIDVLAHLGFSNLPLFDDTIQALLCLVRPVLVIV